MSQLASSTVSQTLTNYARGIFPGLVAAQDPIITRMAPVVLVGGATGKYKSFNDQNSFQKVDTGRAIGGPARRIEFLATDADFNCTPQALEIGIDDHERDAANGLEPQLKEAKTKTLLSTASLSHVNDIVTVAKAGLSAAATPSWADPAAADPVSDVDAQIQAIADATGMFPTDIVFGLGAWRRFRSAAKVISRFPNVPIVGVTVEQAGGIFLNPSIRVGVSTAIRDTVKFGGTKNTANILNAEVFIFYAAPNPTTFDASFMKTFSTGNAMVQSVREYREERNRSDMLAVDWSRDIKVTSAATARRLTVTLA